MGRNIDYTPPERISQDLRRKIRFLVKWNDGDSWCGVADELIERFYPSLSRDEKLVCKELLDCLRDRGSCCAREELEYRIMQEKIFKTESQMRIILHILHSKGIVNWRTRYHLTKSQDGKILLSAKCEIYSIIPETLYDIAMAAYNEVLEIWFEKDRMSGLMKDCSLPIEYTQYLLWSNPPAEFFPILN